MQCLSDEMMMALGRGELTLSGPGIFRGYRNWLRHLIKSRIKDCQSPQFVIRKRAVQKQRLSWPELAGKQVNAYLSLVSLSPKNPWQCTILIIIHVTHQVGVVWMVSAHVSLQLAEAGKALATVAGDVGGARAEAGA